MDSETLERLLERLQQAGLIRMEQSRIKSTGDGWWAFDRDAPQARIPEIPLHEYLRWILEQLNYGQYDLLGRRA